MPKSKEDLNVMALEGQKILLESYELIDWSTFSAKALLNFAKSQVIAIRRGRTSMKRNPNRESEAAWVDVIETSLEILHSCILQVNYMIRSEEMTTIDLSTALSLIADYVKLCNDEENLRTPKDDDKSTTLDGEILETSLNSYLE
jgi:hypothetical protein